jgi:hypothetical protein
VATTRVEEGAKLIRVKFRVLNELLVDRVPNRENGPRDAFSASSRISFSRCIRV